MRKTLVACIAAAGLMATINPASAAAAYAGAGAASYNFVYGGGPGCWTGSFWYFTSAEYADTTGATYNWAKMEWMTQSCNISNTAVSSWWLTVHFGPCQAFGTVTDTAGLLNGQLTGTCTGHAGSVARVVVTGRDDGTSVVGALALQADVAA